MVSYEKRDTAYSIATRYKAENCIALLDQHRENMNRARFIQNR